MEEGTSDFTKQTSQNQGEPDTWPKGASVQPTIFQKKTLPEN